MGAETENAVRLQLNPRHKSGLISSEDPPDIELSIKPFSRKKSPNSSPNGNVEDGPAGSPASSGGSAATGPHAGEANGHHPNGKVADDDLHDVEM